MAFAPAGSAGFFRGILPERIGLLETVAPSFGECLFHAAASLFDPGHGAVCLLNSDSPTLPVAYLIAAATALAAPGDRVVLGPSTDGGYYLIGLETAAPPAFSGHRLEHGAGSGADLGARPGAWAARAPAAVLVRRR